MSLWGGSRWKEVEWSATSIVFPGYLLRLAHWQTSSWKRSSQGWISDFNIRQKSLFTSSSPWIIAPPQNSKFVLRAHKWSRQKKTGTTAFHHYHYQGRKLLQLSSSWPPSSLGMVMTVVLIAGEPIVQGLVNGHQLPTNRPFHWTSFISVVLQWQDF